MNKKNKTLDASQIMEFLPHRYPCLYIDKIVDYELGKSITAIKNVSINEPFFQGHFPGKPVVPGVIIIEAMAQAGGVLGHLTVGDIKPKPIYYIVSVEQARFRFPVEAGDQLTIKVEVDRIIRGMWRYSCNAYVNDEVSVTAKIMCAPNTPN
jgi:3-hydroxyacyl-[acyl-carrier-protein] dehydratase